MSYRKGEIYCSIGEKDYLSLRETMAYLDSSEKSIRKAVDSGLKIIRLGNRILFSKKSISAYLDSLEE